MLFHLDTEKKLIALTIDDGPSEHTQVILELLKAHNAAATFFVIGSQVPGHEQVLQDLIEAGCELGNHAMHDEPSLSLSTHVLIEQIQQVEGILDGAYARAGAPIPPRYFRPGSGFFSTTMCEVLSRLGYRLVLGNIYPHDPQVPYSGLNAWHILSMLQPGGIIICHDRRRWTAPMLRKVLPEISRRGYRAVTVSTLLRETQGQ